MGNAWHSYTCIGGDERLPKTTFPMASMSHGSKHHVDSSQGGWRLVRSPHITGLGTFLDDVPKVRRCINNSRLIIRSRLMKHVTPRYCDSNSWEKYTEHQNSDMNHFILFWEIVILCVRKTSLACTLNSVNPKGVQIKVSAKFGKHG